MPEEQPDPDLLIALKKENEELREKLKAIEAEKDLLRRKDAIDEMVDEAETKLGDRIKRVGTVITATLAVVGITTFGNLVSEVRKSIDDKAIQTIKEEATKAITANVRQSVAEQVRKDIVNDPAFRNAVQKDVVSALAQDPDLRNKITQDPALKARITSIAETTLRKSLLETSGLAGELGNFAQAVEKTYQQETYYVVAGSSTQKSDLERDVQGKALSKGFSTRICPPRPENLPENKRFAIVVSKSPNLSLSYDKAQTVQKQAQQVIQEDAYVLSKTNAFFDCDRIKS